MNKIAVVTHYNYHRDYNLHDVERICRQHANKLHINILKSIKETQNVTLVVLSKSRKSLSRWHCLVLLL